MEPETEAQLRKRIESLEGLVFSLIAENRELMEAVNEMNEELEQQKFERYD